MTKTLTYRQMLNLFATLAVIIVNALANGLPINNQTTAQVSDRYPTLFTPAGYVFAIWGVIYLALLAFSIYQILPSQQDSAYLDSVGILFMLSCVANVAWILLWHYDLIYLTLIAMLGLLLCLALTYWRLGIGKSRVPKAEKWLVHVPFSIYLSWISVATIANLAAALVRLNWSGCGISPQVWTALAVIVAGAIGAVIALTRKDIAYIAVAVWALLGIAFKSGQRPWVMTVASIVALVLITAPVWGMRDVFRKKRAEPPAEQGTPQPVA